MPETWPVNLRQIKHRQLQVLQIPQRTQGLIIDACFVQIQVFQPRHPADRAHPACCDLRRCEIKPLQCRSARQSGDSIVTDRVKVRDDSFERRKLSKRVRFLVTARKRNSQVLKPRQRREGANAVERDRRVVNRQTVEQL